MKKTFAFALSFFASMALITNVFAAEPTIDGFTIQSYLKLSNNSPVSATSGDFVFAIFKNSNCIWAKRYSGVAINSGVMNQKISGAGTNIVLINNGSATTGECVSNFSTTVLDEALLNSGASGALSIRVYTETMIDTQKPIWDVPLNSAPTAFIAKSAQQANDLIPSKKVTTSLGAVDSGKFPILNTSGYIDNSMLNVSSFSIANTQITGLGTACTMNTGTTIGTLPVLGTGGKIASSMMPNYSPNRILATDASGVISGMYNTTQTSSGSVDTNKVPLLNSSGKIDNSMIDSTSLATDPNLLSSNVSVSKGGTGSSSLSVNSLLVGNGTNPVSTLAPGPLGTILLSNGTSWSSYLPNAANIVDMTSNQSSIGGNKTFTGSTSFSGSAAFNGSFTLGSGGYTFQKVLKCSIANSAQTSGTETTATCNGATTSSVAQCSPTSAPNTGWIIASARISADNTVAVMPYLVTGSAAWSTGYQCVIFVP